MKTQVIIEENKPIVVERYEGDLKVGERSVFFVDFVRALTHEVPIGTIVQSIVEREDELNELMERSTFSIELLELLIALTKYANKWEIDEIREIQEFLAVGLEKVKPENINPEILNKIIKNYIFRLKNNETLDYNELFLELLKTFSKDKQEMNVLTKEMYQLLNGMLEENAKQQLENNLSNILRMMDTKFIHREYQEIIQKENNIVYGGGRIPKNCVYFTVGSKYNTYVLDIPKAQFRIKFANASLDDVGHPRMLAVVKANTERIGLLALCAIKEDVKTISEDTPIYHYPYAHVFSSGKVCWSGYEKYIDQIEHLPYMFLSGANAGHLNPDAATLYGKFEGKPFDDDILKPMGNLKQLL